MGDSFKELFIDIVEDPGLCALCGKNQTQGKCKQCEPHHYVCVQCQDQHRQDLFG
jgi:hypothetical protein